MKNLRGNICRLCCRKDPKPWRQSDFIINNSAFLLARSSILESPLEIEHQIDKLERFFSLAGQLACGVFITRGTVTSLITSNNVRAIPETAPLAMHTELFYPLLSAPGAISLRLSDNTRVVLVFVRCPKFSRHLYSAKRLTFPVRPPGLRTTITPPSVALVQRRVHLAANRNLLEIKGMGRESC